MKILNQPLEWSLKNFTNNVFQGIFLFLYIGFCQIIIYNLVLNTTFSTLNNLCMAL